MSNYGAQIGAAKRRRNERRQADERVRQMRLRAERAEAGCEALSAAIKGLSWGRCDYAGCDGPVYPNFDSAFCPDHSDDEGDC